MCVFADLLCCGSKALGRLSAHTCDVHIARRDRAQTHSSSHLSFLRSYLNCVCVCVRIHRRANSDFDRLILDWTSYNDVVVYTNRNTVHAKLSLNCLFMHRRLVHVNKSVSRIKVVGIHTCTTFMTVPYIACVTKDVKHLSGQCVVVQFCL